MAAGVKFALSLGLADGLRELIDSEADHGESVSLSIKGETVDPSSPVRIPLDFRADQIKELDELAKEAMF
jgi:hypothetical protein